MSSYETILYQKKGAVAFVILNRPERLNALNRKMMEELPQVWEEFDKDSQTVAAVLTGSGDRALCSGMDVKEAASQGTEFSLRQQESRPEAMTKLTPFDCGVRKPVICAVNGVCAGGGLAFVSDCDIVICSENATFFDARVSVGQVSVVGTIRLTRRIPLEAVLRMALLGSQERLSARRALELGLVSEVVPQTQLIPRATEIAQKIAENSPAALASTKKAVWGSLNFGLDKGVEYGWQIINAYMGHPDSREGPRAFAEKRKPRWTAL